jgi:general secretion pathway protein H
MIDGRRREGASVSGFTLLEMLVVLTILALVVVVVMPFLAQPSDNLRLQATAREIIGALRLTRASAIVRNIDMVLSIDADKRIVESPAIRTISFAPDISAHLTIAKPESPTPSRGGFRFFPDGSSTGGDLTLSLRGKDAKICVNWMTGLAQQGRGC